MDLEQYLVIRRGMFVGVDRTSKHLPPPQGGGRILHFCVCLCYMTQDYQIWQGNQGWRHRGGLGEGLEPPVGEGLPPVGEFKDFSRGWVGYDFH